MTMSEQAIDEIRDVFAKIDDSAVDAAVAMIADANKVVVFGGGREGLQIRGLAMRLFHMGLQASVVGDMTTPTIGKGDLFLVTVGPGEISTALALLDVAKKAGATILFITAQPAGRGAKFADRVLVLPAQTMANDRGVAKTSVLPMGSLYEGCLFVLFEIMVLRLKDELCWILGDGVDQAADISWFATSISSRNFTPRTIFGN